MPLRRHPDLAVLVLALPVFLLTGPPVAGWALAAVLWVGLSALRALFQSRADASQDPKTVIGYVVGGALLRAWLGALCVLVVGMLTSDAIGLSAVVLLLCLFTVEFGTRAIRQAGSSLQAAPQGAPSRGAGSEERSR